MKKLNQLISCEYNTPITGICTNTNEIKKGNLFICIKGANFDRHNFIEEAIEKGASALITNRDIESGIPYVKVDDLNLALVQICQNFYDFNDANLKLFGVTGTDGKKSVSSIVQALIGNDRCGNIGTNGRSCKNFNKNTKNTTPPPDKLYKYFQEFTKNGCNNISMEISSESILQHRVSGLYFDVIGLTNITREHLNSHGSLKNYVSCKKEIMTLTKKIGYCILNKDDKYFKQVKQICQGRVLAYGKGIDNDFAILDYSLSDTCTKIKFRYLEKEYNIISPLLSDFNVYNLACAMLMCLSQNFDINYLINNIKNINVPGRLDFIDLGQNFKLMIDYAHTPNGVSKLLEFVKILKPNNIIAVSGQAGQRDATKRKLIGEILVKNADKAIFTYEDPRFENPMNIINDMIENVKDCNNYKIILNRSKAIEYAINSAKENDLVVILGKGVERYQEINGESIYFSDIEEAKKFLKIKINNEKKLLKC